MSPALLRLHALVLPEGWAPDAEDQPAIVVVPDPEDRSRLLVCVNAESTDWEAP